MTGLFALHLAEQLARIFHRNQVDLSGSPYILHVEEVARRCEACTEKTVAWLHDIVEDTPCTLEDLERLGFLDSVVKAVDAITRRDSEKYMDYIRRVKLNPVATRVKLADLSHNTEPRRIEALPPEKRGIVNRYRKAIILLTEDEMLWG